MADRENVITQLKIISTWASFARGHDLQFFTEKHFEDMEQWANDAIAMLKEDCHNCKLECLLQKYDELKEKYDAMLKEQESLLGIQQTADSITFISTGTAQQGEARGLLLGKMAMHEWLKKELLYRGLLTDDIRAVFDEAKRQGEEDNSLT